MGAARGMGGGAMGAAKPPADGDGKPAAAPATELRPNMTANVEFVLDDHPDVLILAARFIQYDEERNAYCEVLPDPENQEVRERRELELGFSDGMRFEVVEGLAEGDTVILERPIIEEDRRF
jgi:multidrug efflux pump subunit AcrA (membrane-fusion protein)